MARWNRSHVGLDMDEVAGEHADEDLGEGDGDAGADRDQAGNECKADPQGRDQIDVIQGD
jgi:hypothetical protein